MALATVEGMNTPFSYPGLHTLRCWACGQFFPAVKKDAKFCTDGCRVWASRRKRNRQPWHFRRVYVTQGDPATTQGNETARTISNDNATQRAICNDSATAPICSHEDVLQRTTSDDWCNIVAPSSPLFIENSTHQELSSSSVPLFCYTAGDGVSDPDDVVPSRKQGTERRE
jgi:hypothetical protein